MIDDDAGPLSLGLRLSIVLRDTQINRCCYLPIMPSHCVRRSRSRDAKAVRNLMFSVLRLLLFLLTIAHNISSCNILDSPCAVPEVRCGEAPCPAVTRDYARTRLPRQTSSRPLSSLDASLFPHFTKISSIPSPSGSGDSGVLRTSPDA